MKEELEKENSPSIYSDKEYKEDLLKLNKHLSDARIILSEMVRVSIVNDNISDELILLHNRLAHMISDIDKLKSK